VQDHDPQLQTQRHHTQFAIVNVLDGTVVGRCMPKHTQKEFIERPGSSV